MTPSKYKKIKYAIHTLKKGESAMDYPDLVMLKEDLFSKVDLGGPDPEFVMRYIILMYSPGSPARDDHKHIGKRKTWVMKELGVEPNADGRFEDKYNYVLLNKLTSVTRKISAFISLQKPIDFQIMVHAESELDKWLQFSDTEDYKKMSVDEALKLRTLIEATRKQYQESSDRLMEYERDLLVQYDSNVFVAQSYLGLRAEEMLNFIPPPFQPHEAKADMIFPEVKN